MFEKDSFTDQDLQDWLSMHAEKIAADYANVRKDTPIQRLLEDKIGKEKCFQIFAASTFVKSVFEFLRLRGAGSITEEKVRVALMSFAKRSNREDPYKVAVEMINYAMQTGGGIENPPDKAEQERLENKAEKMRILEEAFTTDSKRSTKKQWI